MTRAGEEPTDCPNFSKIAHRYISDFEEFLQHCRACQEAGGIVATSDPCTE